MTSVISDSSIGVAGELARLIAPLLGDVLPVRLRAWDGSEAGPEGAPTLVLRSPRALRRLLWHPGELGLAQAYVTGEIDVEGGAAGLTDGFRRIWAAARERTTSPDLRAAQELSAADRPRPAPRPGCGGDCTAGGATGPRSLTTTTCRTSSTSSSWTRTWPTHAGTGRRTTRPTR
jgi:hypothetical protein